MPKMSNFLDTDPTILENNLRFVRNEAEEELDNIFGAVAGKQIGAPIDSKVVMPSPGICIKCFKVNTNEKFFINICQTDAIPPPEDINEDELAHILSSDEPSSYRIPMSICEPRVTTDKSGSPVDACDVAINNKFLKKCLDQILFRDFLVAIILEAMSEKHNVQLKSDNWIVLKNRKCMGQLVSHRIQNRDVKTVYNSYKTTSPEQKKIMEDMKIGGKKLIQEIDIEERKSTKCEKKELPTSPRGSEQLKRSVSISSSMMPKFKLIGCLKGSTVKEIIAEFFLPKCVSANDLVLDIGEDRIVLESLKCGYFFDQFVEYSFDQDNATAKFNQATKMLSIRLPIIISDKH